MVFLIRMIEDTTSTHIHHDTAHDESTNDYSTVHKMAAALSILQTLISMAGSPLSLTSPSPSSSVCTSSSPTVSASHFPLLTKHISKSLLTLGKVLLTMRSVPAKTTNHRRKQIKSRPTQRMILREKERLTHGSHVCRLLFVLLSTLMQSQHQSFAPSSSSFSSSSFSSASPSPVTSPTPTLQNVNVRLSSFGYPIFDAVDVNLRWFRRIWLLYTLVILPLSPSPPPLFMSLSGASSKLSPSLPAPSFSPFSSAPKHGVSSVGVGGKTSTGEGVKVSEGVGGHRNHSSATRTTHKNLSPAPLGNGACFDAVSGSESKSSHAYFSYASPLLSIHSSLDAILDIGSFSMTAQSLRHTKKRLLSLIEKYNPYQPLSLSHGAASSVAFSPSSSSLSSSSHIPGYQSFQSSGLANSDGVYGDAQDGGDDDELDSASSPSSFSSLFASSLEQHRYLHLDFEGTFL